LSPLYISVHSTDEQVRRRLLGRDDIPNITETISRLARGNIQMHCQLVICPGFNDGSVLARSVHDLARCFPAVQSVAVVPVGLTGHRNGLHPLKPMGVDLAKRLLKEIEGWQWSYRKTMGIGFVYPADEVFLLAGQSIPSEEYYDNFHQLENGVGMTRQFLDCFEKHQLHYPRGLPRPASVTIVTGQLAAPVLRQTLVKRLLGIENLEVQLRVVPSRFFGGEVTVSGLLTGRDILHSLSQPPASGMLILPPNCLNEDGLFLDDLSPRDVEKELGLPIRISPRTDPLRALEEVWS
jgi:putative radical SAM enzyme (TIGR03279 family)